MKISMPNPYIGPRVFRKEEGHLFFGREREAADLVGLVISEQLLLFYAQSGAGKSSLINARIIPELEARDFEVLPVGRVSGDSPNDIQPPNIYLYNLQRSLIQHDADPQVLSTLSLTDFLMGLDLDENGTFFNKNPKPLGLYEEDVPRRRVLIIDQFEEFFSTHSEAWEQREGFFRNLADAMQDHPGVSVVLVMREDYVASLDPYAHLLPGGMRMRYYMQRLSREAALKAIKSPVAALRPYAAGAAERLVDDLCSITVQAPDGSFVNTPGQFVEAVQLQVVGYSLWQRLPPGGYQIEVDDLQMFGDVDQSLANYYAERVRTVAQEKQVREREIRDWFEHKLIAPGGVRNLVLQEPGRTSGGLDNEVIRALGDLVRAEKRGEATFYELTHDRLVEPILADNQQWRSANTSPLQRQAALWQNQDRRENWLLSGEALVEMEKWAQENPDELTQDDEEFLQACRQHSSLVALKREYEERSRTRSDLLTVITAIGITMIMLPLVWNVVRTAGNPGAITITFLVVGSWILGYFLGRYRRR